MTAAYYPKWTCHNWAQQTVHQLVNSISAVARSSCAETGFTSLTGTATLLDIIYTKQGSKQASKGVSEQAREQARKGVSEQASHQGASKQASKQAREQASKQGSKEAREQGSKPGIKQAKE